MAALRRHPVSPRTTIVVGFAFGRGSVTPATAGALPLAALAPTTALVVLAGRASSQVVTGNADGFDAWGPRAPVPLALVVLVFVRNGSVPAAMRRFIGWGAPPLSVMVGRLVASGIGGARAAPLGPSSTHADSTWLAATASQVTVVVTVLRFEGHEAPLGRGPSSTTTVIVAVPGPGQRNPFE